MRPGAYAHGVIRDTHAAYRDLLALGGYQGSTLAWRRWHRLLRAWRDLEIQDARLPLSPANPLWSGARRRARAARSATCPRASSAARGDRRAWRWRPGKWISTLFATGCAPPSTRRAPWTDDPVSTEAHTFVNRLAVNHLCAEMRASVHPTPDKIVLILER